MTRKIVKRSTFFAPDHPNLWSSSKKIILLLNIICLKLGKNYSSVELGGWRWRRGVVQQNRGRWLSAACGLKNVSSLSPLRFQYKYNLSAFPWWWGPAGWDKIPVFFCRSRWGESMRKVARVDSSICELLKCSSNNVLSMGGKEV